MKLIKLTFALSFLLTINSCQKEANETYYDFNVSYKISNSTRYIQLDSLSYTGRYGGLITEINPVLPFHKTVYSEDYIPLYFMAYGEYKEGGNPFVSDLEMNISGRFNEYRDNGGSSRGGIRTSLKTGFRQYRSADTALLNDTIVISLDQIGF